MSNLSKIKQNFDEYFSAWDIFLPESDLLNFSPGKIVKSGWAIWYLFGEDEKGPFLDYYSSHRMTNDYHCRLYADGTKEELPALADFYVTTNEASADQAAKARYLSRNDEICQMLIEKGFHITGDEPGGVQINNFLKRTDFD